MIQQYQSIDTQMAQVAARRQTIVNQLQNSDGQTAALQAVGAGIDTLIGQNQTLISTLVAQGRLAQKNQGDDALARKKSSDYITERQQRLIDADKPFQ
jgi:flagellar biosynthesis/type III secretory pathway chaperone